MPVRVSRRSRKAALKAEDLLESSEWARWRAKMGGTAG
jgi:hypothetical protein